MPFVIEDDDAIPRGNEIFIVALYSDNPQQNAIETCLDLKTAKQRFNQWAGHIGNNGNGYRELIIYRCSFANEDDVEDSRINTYTACAYSTIHYLWDSELVLMFPHTDHPQVTTKKKTAPTTNANGTTVTAAANTITFTAGVEAAFDLITPVTTTALLNNAWDAQPLPTVEFSGHGWLNMPDLEGVSPDTEIAYNTVVDILASKLEDAYYFFTEDIGLHEGDAQSNLITYTGDLIAYWIYQIVNFSGPFDPNNPIPSSNHIKFAISDPAAGVSPQDTLWDNVVVPQWFHFILDNLTNEVFESVGVSWNNSSVLSDVGPDAETFFDLEGEVFASWFGGRLMMFSDGGKHLIFVHKFVDSPSYFALNDIDTDELVYSLAVYNTELNTFVTHASFKTETEVYNDIQGFLNAANVAAPA